MTEIPILSICIPAYNRPLWFRRGLRSLIEGGLALQSKVEVVITDDSEEQTCRAIAELVANDLEAIFLAIQVRMEINRDHRYKVR